MLLQFRFRKRTFLICSYLCQVAPIQKDTLVIACYDNICRLQLSPVVKIEIAETETDALKGQRHNGIHKIIIYIVSHLPQ